MKLKYPICLKFIFFLLSGTPLISVNAQQDPQFSQYFLNQYMFNPAYGGIDNSLSITAHLRAQWVGISGHPFSQNVSVHTPVSLLHGGAGAQILNEEEGAIRITSASVSYSFIYKSRIGKFSAGLSGGLIQGTLDGNKLRAPEGTYENSLVQHNDPVLPVVSVNGLGPDFSAGLFFSNSRLNIGLSANHLLPMSIKINSGGENLELDLARQYYFQISYLGMLGNSLSLRPAVLLKSNGNSLQGEADLLLAYNDFIWFGGGFRGYNNLTQDAVIGIAGINIGENLRIGYSYDYTLSALQSASDGSHEIVLNYRVNLLKPAKPGKAIYNPRF